MPVAKSELARNEVISRRATHLVDSGYVQGGLAVTLFAVLVNNRQTVIF